MLHLSQLWECYLGSVGKLFPLLAATVVVMVATKSFGVMFVITEFADFFLFVAKSFCYHVKISSHLMRKYQ